MELKQLFNVFFLEDREQIRFGTLSDGIGANHPVRFIDAFVDKIDLFQLGFKLKTIKEEGHPAYDPKVLMKLYLLNETFLNQ